MKYLKIFFLLTIFPNISYAYLDGGFLSMIIQFFVAFIAGALIYLRFTLSKVKEFFKKIFSFLK